MTHYYTPEENLKYSGMSKYEIALHLWQNDPYILSVREEAKREAKRLGQGFCADQFIFAPKGLNGKVGALYLVEQRVPIIRDACPRIDCEVSMFLRRFLEFTTPNCGHIGRNGEPSDCLPSYRVDYGLSYRKDAKNDGFVSLIERLREAGTVQQQV